MSYRICNRSEYNAGLKQRGSLKFWLNDAVLCEWMVEEKSGGRGASKTYSNIAIATFETIKAVYRQARRQTEGLLGSFFKLMGINLSVPDHSTVSRQKSTLTVRLPVVPRAGAVHLVVDSTGIKVYGEGEWKTSQHGISKSRTWRKLHLGIDEATGEILSVVVTTNDVHNGAILGDLVEGAQTDIEQVPGDGAYDQMDCYDVIEQHGAIAAIPPRKNAKIRRHGNCKAPPHPRDKNLRLVCRSGRKDWKR